MKNYPSLKICGNPQASGGYTDIYIINEAAFDIPNQSHEGMVMQPYYFVIKITEYNVQYVLVHNKVKSFGATRAGVLKLGISIPKNYRLSGGKSPYDVLMEVYQLMLSTNLTLIPGSMDEYQYNAVMAPQTLFEDVVAKYPFEKYVSAYRPMRGQSPALLITDKIREVMIDPQFAEFSPYREVIVASAGNYPTTVKVPAVPRQPKYTLFLNGKLKDWGSVNLWMEEITITPSNVDLDCYDVPEVRFRLPTIVNDPTTAPKGVIVDTENEIIRASIQPRPKDLYYRIDIDGDDIDENKALRNLIVRVGGIQKPLTPQGMLHVSGDEIKKMFSFEYPSKEYKLAGEPQRDNKNRRIRLRLVSTAPKAQAVTSPYMPNGGVPYQNQQGGKPLQNSFFEPQRVCIIAEREAFTGKGESIGHVKLTSSAGLSYDCDLRFSLVGSNQGIEYWISTEFDIPAPLLTPTNSYRVSLETPVCKYENVTVSVKNQQFKKKLVPTLSLIGSEMVKTSFFSKFIDPWVILALVLLLCLGFVAGWFVNNIVNRDASKTEETAQAEGREGDTNPGITDLTGGATNEQTADPEAEFIEQAKVLDSPDVTFEQIQNLMNMVDRLQVQSSPEIEKYVNRIRDYNKVVEFFSSINDKYDPYGSNVVIISDFWEIMRDIQPSITPEQLEMCRLVYRYWANDTQKGKAGDVLATQSMGDKIHSFADIKKVMDEATPSIKSSGTPRANNASGNKTSTRNNRNTNDEH